MNRIVNNQSFFVPHHKRIKRANRLGFSADRDHSLYDERNQKNRRDFPKGLVRPSEIPVQDMKQPDYLEQNFRQYSWPGQETYRKEREPFFTSKDPIENFLNPREIPGAGNNPINNDVEAQTGLRQTGGASDTEAQEILKDIIRQRDEFSPYQQQTVEAEQNISHYQDGSKEMVEQAMINTFGDSFEINQAVHEVQNQDTSQEELDIPTDENVPAQFGTAMEDNMEYGPAAMQEPQPEMAQEDTAPMEDGMEQNLEDIAEQPQEMMEPPPDPFTVPGLFGPYMP